MSVMIGIDPHKGSHTAVVIDSDEVVIEEIRVKASRPPHCVCKSVECASS